MKSKASIVIVIFISLILALAILLGCFFGIPYLQQKQEAIADTYRFISVEGGVKILGYQKDVLYSNYGDLIIPNKINGRKVVEIAEGAFRSNSYIVSVEIPSTVKVIGDRAFEKCVNMERVKMGNSVETIGVGAFSDCVKLKEIEWSRKLTKIKESAFSNCTKLATTTIPENVRLIEKQAFKNCVLLESVYFENANGWEVVDSNKSITMELNNAQANANYLKSTYSNYLWIYIE